jgi:hypothetical protein
MGANEKLQQVSKGMNDRNKWITDAVDGIKNAFTETEEEKQAKQQKKEAEKQKKAEKMSKVEGRGEYVYGRTDSSQDTQKKDIYKTIMERINPQKKDTLISEMINTQPKQEEKAPDQIPKDFWTEDMILLRGEWMREFNGKYFDKNTSLEKINDMFYHDYNNRIKNTLRRQYGGN